MNGINGLVADDIAALNNRITELERQRQQDLKTIDTLAMGINELNAVVDGLRDDLANLRDWCGRFHARQIEVNRDILNMFQHMGGKR